RVLDAHTGKVSNGIGRHIRGGVVNLVEQLLLAGGRCDRAAGSRHFRDDDRSEFGYFRNRKSKVAKSLDILEARIGEIAAGNLSRASEQMSDERRAPQRRPVVHRPLVFVYQWCNEE